MSLGTERAAVQNPFLCYAEEAGWTYLSSEAALNLRRGITSPVLDAVLIQQLQRLNPAVIDAQRAEDMARRITRVRPNIEGNLDAWEYLKGLKTVFVEEQRRERNLKLLDLNDLGRNTFHVTDEFTFSNGTPPDIRTDLTFFINGIPVDKSFLRKTARLVQAYTQAGEVQEPTAVHTLGEAALAQIAASNKSDTVKVFNLLKVLHDLVHGKAHEQPWLISIGDRAEAIARAFEQRQQTTQDALAALEELVRDLREAEHRRDETGLAPEAFAVLWYLKKEDVAQAEEVARRAAAAFEAHPHWQASDHQEQEVRKALYKALIDTGADGVVELANGVLRMLRRASL